MYYTRKPLTLSSTFPMETNKMPHTCPVCKEKDILCLLTCGHGLCGRCPKLLHDNQTQKLFISCPECRKNSFHIVPLPGTRRSQIDIVPGIYPENTSNCQNAHSVTPQIVIQVPYCNSFEFKYRTQDVWRKRLNKIVAQFSDPAKYDLHAEKTAYGGFAQSIRSIALRDSGRITRKYPKKLRQCLTNRHNNMPMTMCRVCFGEAGLHCMTYPPCCNRPICDTCACIFAKNISFIAKYRKFLELPVCVACGYKPSPKSNARIVFDGPRKTPRQLSEIKQGNPNFIHRDNIRSDGHEEKFTLSNMNHIGMILAAYRATNRPS